MKFSELLNKYMTDGGLTVSALASASGISKTAVSQYKNGNQKPKEDTLKRLSEAIAELSAKNGSETLSPSQVYDTLSASLQSSEFDSRIIMSNLNLAINTLGINANELSRFINFDASYLSRLRSNLRSPSDTAKFCRDVAGFVSRRYSGDNSAALADLIGCERKEVLSQSDCYYTFLRWLTEKDCGNNDIMQQFLVKLNDFDLGSYIRNLSFDDMDKAMPDIKPVDFDTKDYYTIEGFMTAELDWLQTVIFSDSKEPVFVYSDMPIEKMSENQVFLKKWMSGMALMLKKGLRINIVHNIERSFTEMMLGLENWIPFYMTGNVSPYYLKGYSVKCFHNFLHVSDNAALSGEAIKGHYRNGRYHFSRTPEELAYYKKKSDAILCSASPLMEIYRKEHSASYSAFFMNNYMCETDSFRNILSSPPLYTISPELLKRILERNCVEEEEKNRILEFASQYKERFENITNSITDELAEMTKKEFEKYPVLLHLNDMFCERTVTYSYEEYRRHIELTRKCARCRENYQVVISQNNPFRNIQIRMVLDKFAIISKNNSPIIHFVVKHRKLRQALENMVVHSRE